MGLHFYNHLETLDKKEEAEGTDPQVEGYQYAGRI